MKKQCPSRKRRFHDHEEAVKMLRTIQQRNQRERTPVRVYECNVCKGWHLTAQKEWGVEP